VKIVCFICLAIILTSCNVWADGFSIISTQYEILGRVGSQQYHFTSSSPLSQTITDTTTPSNLGKYSYAQSIAGDGAFVSVAIDQPGCCTPGSAAEAIAVIDFTANFDGSADWILFYGHTPSESGYAGMKAVWNIRDLTSNSIVVLDNSGAWDFSTHLKYGDNIGNFSSNYSWDSSHLYELKMVVQTGSNHGDDGGSISTNMFSVPAPVPEPSSAILLTIALAGLIAAKCMGYQPSFTRAARQPSRNSQS